MAMTKKEPNPAAEGKAARAARLAAELRANLAKRKAQTRERDGAKAPQGRVGQNTNRQED
jgi:hypothetical protein